MLPRYPILPHSEALIFRPSGASVVQLPLYLHKGFAFRLGREAKNQNGAYRHDREEC